MRPLFSLLLLGLALGCTPFPELEQATSAGARSADYPKLVPLDGLLTEAADVQITPDLTRGIEARVAALRARADRLRGRTVIEPPVRAAMRAAARKRP